jgi:hypothetical protein
MHQHDDDREALLKLSSLDIYNVFRAYKTDRNYTEDGFGYAVQRIIRNWGMDYCPVYSITGSIISRRWSITSKVLIALRQPLISPHSIG